MDSSITCHARHILQVTDPPCVCRLRFYFNFANFLIHYIASSGVHVCVRAIDHGIMYSIPGSLISDTRIDTHI